MTRKKQSFLESKVKEIKRATKRKFSAEEKTRIVLEGLRGEDSIVGVCRREGIRPNLYYNWSTEFLEDGKRRLNGDTTRQVTSSEVLELREQNDELKRLVAELSLETRSYKKSQIGTE